MIIQRRAPILGAATVALGLFGAGCGSSGEPDGQGAAGCDGCSAPSGDAAGSGTVAGDPGGAGTAGSADGAGSAASDGAGGEEGGAPATSAGAGGAAAGTGAAAAGAGAAGGGTAGTGDACVPAWSCNAWSELGDGRYQRSCVDDNACGDDATRPPEGPVELPALDEPFFRCNVQPIFDWGCAMLGCHGTETGRAFRLYAPGRLRNDEIVTRVGTCIPATGTVNLAEAASGTVMCEGRLPHTAEESRKNFDNARSFMLGVSEPEASELLAQPVVGGKAHAGVHLFRQGDARYQTIRDWLAGESQASCP